MTGLGLFQLESIVKDKNEVQEAMILEGIVSTDTHKAIVGDMAPLISRVRTFLAERRDRVDIRRASADGHTLEEQFGFTARKAGRPQVILASDTAVELGHPSTASQAVVLLTFQPDLVEEGRITVAGPDFDSMDGDGPHPFGQVVMLAVDDARVPDPFEIDNTQYLMHRLPGYMVRSVPGRLWARVGRAARRSGMTLGTLGSALISAYVEEFEGVLKAEVLFITSSREDVEALSVVSTEAQILAGRHKKLVLGIDGDVECAELACETCEEKPVCDDLRDIVIKRRKTLQ